MSAPGPDGQPRYADARLSGEMLRCTALTLQPDGWVKAHTCSDRFDIHAKMEDRACDRVEGARRYYDSTGDQTVIKEIWPVIVAQLNFYGQNTDAFDTKNLSTIRTKWPGMANSSTMTTWEEFDGGNGEHLVRPDPAGRRQERPGHDDGELARFE